MSTIFKDPVSNKDSGVLANLWRKVVLESNLQHSIRHLADRYVKKTNPMSQRVSNVKKRTKSTVLKNISDPDMTIKTFLDLIFNLLGAKKLTISIKITYPNGTETIHSLPINNGDLVESDLLDEDVEDESILTKKVKDENTDSNIVKTSSE